MLIPHLSLSLSLSHLGYGLWVLGLMNFMQVVCGPIRLSGAYASHHDRHTQHNTRNTRNATLQPPTQHNTTLPLLNLPHGNCCVFFLLSATWLIFLFIPVIFYFPFLFCSMIQIVIIFQWDCDFFPIIVFYIVTDTSFRYFPYVSSPMCFHEHCHFSFISIFSSFQNSKILATNTWFPFTSWPCSRSS